MSKRMRKKTQKDNLRIIPTKVDPWDEGQIQSKADTYARGNRSAWVRHASLNYVPKPGERIGRKAG